MGFYVDNDRKKKTVFIHTVVYFNNTPVNLTATFKRL